MARGTWWSGFVFRNKGTACCVVCIACLWRRISFTWANCVSVFLGMRSLSWSHVSPGSARRAYRIFCFLALQLSRPRAWQFGRAMVFGFGVIVLHDLFNLFIRWFLHHNEHRFYLWMLLACARAVWSFFSCWVMFAIGSDVGVHLVEMPKTARRGQLAETVVAWIVPLLCSAAKWLRVQLHLPRLTPPTWKFWC